MPVDASWRWIAWTILGIGGLITAGGVMMGLANLRYALHGERADGIVIENLREGDMYAPVVQFRLPQGETAEVKDLGAGSPDFFVGDTVTVLYFPESPRDFRLDTFERLWLMPIIITGFGGFWLMFGAVAWALSRNADLALVGERAFSVISLSALLIGVFVVWSTVELYSTGGRARGTVTEMRESRSIVSEEVTTPGGREVLREVERITLAPIVRFVTVEGREIEFHGRGGRGASFKAGEVVEVVYDRSQPSRARIVSFVDLWLPAAVAFAVSVLFGGAVALSRRSRRKP